MPEVLTVGYIQPWRPFFPKENRRMAPREPPDAGPGNRHFRPTYPGWGRPMSSGVPQTLLVLSRCKHATQ
jgi:hypothetical protein